MDNLLDVSNSLKSYFANHRLFKILLPLDTIIVLVSLIVLAVDYLVYVPDFGFLWAVGFWGMVTGLLMAVANSNWTFVAIGLMGYAVINILDFIISLFRYQYFYFDELIFAGILGLLGYYALQRSNKQKISPPDVQNKVV